MLTRQKRIPEALPLIKPEQPNGPQRADRVPQAMARNIKYTARVVSRDAPSLNEAVNKQAEQENHAAVVEQKRRAARKPSQKESPQRRPLFSVAHIAHW